METNHDTPYNLGIQHCRELQEDFFSKKWTCNRNEKGERIKKRRSGVQNKYMVARERPGGEHLCLTTLPKKPTHCVKFPWLMTFTKRVASPSVLRAKLREEELRRSHTKLFNDQKKKENEGGKRKTDKILLILYFSTFRFEKWRCTYWRKHIGSQYLYFASHLCIWITYFTQMTRKD